MKVNPKDFARFAIGGVDAAGKTRLGDELAPLIEALGLMSSAVLSIASAGPARHREGGGANPDVQLG